MDALSDVLSAIRLDGAVYINAEFTETLVCRDAVWTPQRGQPVAALRSYRLLPSSDGWSVPGARRAGGETVEVKAGDLLLLPHDNLHLLGTDLKLPPAGMEDIVGSQAGLDSDALRRQRRSYPVHLHATGGRLERC